MNQPGTYLGFDVRGNPRKPRELGPTEVDAQFFVRILVSKGREREREREREGERERDREGEGKRESNTINVKVLNDKFCIFQRQKHIYYEIKNPGGGASVFVRKN